jgi:hypothetical protein
MLNESKNPYSKDYPQKQEDYLIKIIDLLVVSSKLVEREDDYGEPITYVMTDGVDILPVGFTSSWGMSIYHNFLWELKNHLERTYGLTELETDYVWDKYKKKMVVFNNRENSYSLIPELGYGKSLNESKEPKINPSTSDFENIDKKFLDKVVGVLKNETEYNPQYRRLTLPLRPYNLNNLGGYSHYLTSEYLDDDKPYQSFYKDMKGLFSIRKDIEVIYVFQNYKKFILELITPTH